MNSALDTAKADMRAALADAGFSDEQIAVLSRPLARYVAAVVRHERAACKTRVDGLMALIKVKDQIGAAIHNLNQYRTGGAS